MRYYYAIMSADICTGIIDTFAEIIRPDYMQIPEYDASIVGKRWNGTGWEVVE